MKKKKPLKILIVDDHKMVRNSLHLVLDETKDIEVVGEAADGKEAIKQNNQLSPDIILMDIRMPNMDGLQAMIKIKIQSPDSKIMVLSVLDEKQSVREAFNVGASGYAIKEIREAELKEAIDQVSSGKYYIHPGVAHYLFSELSRADTLDLTSNEADILRMIAEGMSNAEISTETGQNLKKTKKAVAEVLDKIRPVEKVQDVAIAIRKERLD